MISIFSVFNPDDIIGA